MTRSNLYVEYQSVSKIGTLYFEDGEISSFGLDYDDHAFTLNYSSALNLASKLLQWATNLPESEKGNIHKIDGEWVDIDGHSED